MITTLGSIVALGLVIGCRGTVVDEGPHRPFSGARCNEPTATTNPIRRLTPAQYAAAAQRLFPGVELPDVTLPGNSVQGAFENDVRGQGVSDLLVEQYANGAADIATAALADRSWMSCEMPSAACAEDLAESLATRAYRRPLTDEERASFRGFIETQSVEFGVEETLAMFIEALLQTPQFLYLPEIGDPSIDAPEGQIALSGPELATRLSFFLWNEPPDDELMSAATDGSLVTDEGLGAQIDRMMQDPRAQGAFDGFFRQWMRLERLQTANVDPGLYPELGEPGVREDLERSALRFLRFAFFEDGTFEGLFASRRAYVNDRIAPIFGVPAPGSPEELVAVELPADQRAGILTQPGVLTSTSHGLRHSPILRGVLILDNVLCAPPPPPPDGVMAQFPEEMPGGDAVTTRQKVEQTHGTGDCATCHEAIDGMGFTFESFDAIGRYRTEEYGMPVDTTGTLRGEPVGDAVELGERLSTDPGTARCLTTQVYRYALGRLEQRGDECQIRQLSRAIEDGGDLSALLRGLLMSNAFRYAPVGEE